MALTSAEKQRRYRERHLGVHGSKERIQIFVSVQTKAQLGRLARRCGYTITRVIEDLVKDADRAILDRLPTRQHFTYLDSHPRRMSARSKAKSAKKPAGSRPAPRRKVTV
jgi:Replication regulatory protein RepB